MQLLDSTEYHSYAVGFVQNARFRTYFEAQLADIHDAKSALEWWSKICYDLHLDYVSRRPAEEVFSRDSAIRRGILEPNEHDDDW